MICRLDLGVGKGLGNFIGEFLEYDARISLSFWCSFMRILVSVDITQPLKRAKKIRKQGSEAKIMTLSMKNWRPFVMFVGRLGMEKQRGYF